MKRALVAAVFVWGCGGPAPAGSGSVSGADGFKVVSALSNWQQAPDAGISSAVFFLSDVATDCADVTRRGTLPYSRSALVGSIATEATLGPATAEVDGGVGVAGAISVQHAGGTTDSATDGTIDVTAVDANHVAGTVTVTIAGGTLNAAFDAPVCAAVPL